MYTQDFSNPTLEDHFDKTILPKVMQVCLDGTRSFNLLTQIPFLGIMQTVQTQVRCCQMQHLIRVYIVCLQKFLKKMQLK